MRIAHLEKLNEEKDRRIAELEKTVEEQALMEDAWLNMDETTWWQDGETLWA